MFCLAAAFLGTASLLFGAAALLLGTTTLLGLSLTA